MLTDTNGRGWWSNLWNGIKNFFVNTWDVIVGGIASVALVAAGLAVTIFTGGSLSILGSTLIGAGIGGFINGVISKSDGGSFWGGYLGGAISGGLTGLGLSLGPIGAFVFGFVGNFVGTTVTDAINGTFSNNSKYWGKLIANSLLYGLISIGARTFGNTVELLNSPGFRDLYIGFTVWSEFAATALFEQSQIIVEQIAQVIRKIFGI